MIYLATSSGMVCADRKGDWQVTRRELPGHNVTSVIARGLSVLAGTMKGIFHSKDRGNTWQRAQSGPAIQHIRWMEWVTSPAAYWPGRNRQRSSVRMTVE